MENMEIKIKGDVLKNLLKTAIVSNSDILFNFVKLEDKLNLKVHVCCQCTTYMITQRTSFLSDYKWNFEEDEITFHIGTQDAVAVERSLKANDEVDLVVELQPNGYYTLYFKYGSIRQNFGSTDSNVFLREPKVPYSISISINSEDFVKIAKSFSIEQSNYVDFIYEEIDDEPVFTIQQGRGARKIDMKLRGDEVKKLYKPEDYEGRVVSSVGPDIIGDLKGIFRETVVLKLMSNAPVMFLFQTKIEVEKANKKENKEAIYHEIYTTLFIAPIIICD